jgi:hypothetical protein
LEGQKLPSKKAKELPWWHELDSWDVIPSAKVLRGYNYALLQKIIYAFAKARYTDRPKKSAKCSWAEPVIVDGAKYALSCVVDEVNKKVVITYIRTPKKMKRKHIHT